LVIFDFLLLVGHVPDLEIDVFVLVAGLLGVNDPSLLVYIEDMEAPPAGVHDHVLGV